jgi:hypothetical protein
MKNVDGGISDVISDPGNTDVCRINIQDIGHERGGSEYASRCQACDENSDYVDRGKE